MNVIIAAGGRFHAFQLASQLAQRGCLRRFFTFSYTRTDYERIDISRVRNYRFGAMLDQAYFRLRLNKFVSPSRYNTYKDQLFDQWVAKNVHKEQPFDLLVGWANYVSQSLAVARSRGAKIIIESGSSHIEAQQQLLVSAYDQLGLIHAPITQQNRDRMLYEYQAADYIMTLSSFARKSFIDRGFSQAKILQVPCGIDVDYFLTHGAREQPKKFTVIFVGLLSVRKGIHHLIDAWQELKLPEHTAQLLLVGSMQHDLQQVLKQKSLNKNIIFYGPTSRENLRKLYQQASLFVLPSLEDGFGMVMGEAIASGLPVICTMNTGAPDVIIDGKEGFLVPAGNASALAEKISWCYAQREQAAFMGQQGQQTIQQYTWDRYGENVYEVYRRICAKK